MKHKPKIFWIAAAVAMLVFFLFIVFGEGGYRDYHLLKAQQQEVLDENDTLVKKNISLYHKIERLKHDPRYMEQVVRSDLGAVGKDEIIFKRSPGPPSNKESQGMNIR